MSSSRRLRNSKKVPATAGLADLPDEVLCILAALVPKELHAVSKRARDAVYSATTRLEFSVWSLQRAPDRHRLLHFRNLTSLTLQRVWNLDEPGDVGTSTAFSIAIASLDALPKLTALKCENVCDDTVPVIARLTGLRSLDLRGSKLTYTMPLIALEHLVDLDLGSTAVTHPCALACLPSLRRLGLTDAHTADRTIELGLLEDLTSLLTLDMHCERADTHLVAEAWSSLAPLASLTSLIHLDLSGRLERGPNDLAPLAGLTRLQRLYLRRSRVWDVQCLAGMVSLRELDLSDSSVPDPAPLAALTALTRLSLNSCSHLDTDLSSVGCLTSLRDLDLEKELVRSVF